MTRKYRTQPRVPGVRRLPMAEAVLPEVRAGLQAIADRERRSVSWVVAEIVSDYFGLDVMGEAVKRPLRLVSPPKRKSA